MVGKEHLAVHSMMVWWMGGCFAPKIQLPFLLFHKYKGEQGSWAMAPEMFLFTVPSFLRQPHDLEFLVKHGIPVYSHHLTQEKSDYDKRSSHHTP